MNPKRWASHNLPEPLLDALRPVYRGYTNLKGRLLRLADRLRLVGPETIYSDDYYAKRQEDPWRSDARKVSKAIYDYFDPNSVIDFGCAIGAHLEPFHKRDCKIKGVEGNSDAFEYAVVPEQNLEQHDLRDEYDPERSYDLALCFEVAEHIPERFTDQLTDTLASSGDIVVMTAAEPGQGGTHHVNEQPREFWYRKFESRGMEYDSEAVEQLREEIEVREATWIGENLMIFRGSNA